MYDENTKYYCHIKKLFFHAYAKNRADNFSEIEVHENFTLLLRAVRLHWVHRPFSSGRTSTVSCGFKLKQCAKHIDNKVVSYVGSVLDVYIKTVLL